MNKQLLLVVVLSSLVTTAVTRVYMPTHVSLHIDHPTITDRASDRPLATQPAIANRGIERDSWQYKVEDYPHDYPSSKGLQGWLNERGADGWEVCSGSAYLSRFTFKRRGYRL